MLSNTIDAGTTTSTDTWPGSPAPSTVKVAYPSPTRVEPAERTGSPGTAYVHSIVRDRP
ncbi:hypothetical protein [Cellulosimicrobium sp. CUA-896]|uniref:hypothetical protein n=1 Tax=Cellulosimicrobium sp. CUA-896 TaxID=1517881 RepID=UPI00130134E6|nr:hypothetical protein [Cellulosimicrobium sp. CUA-896]